MIDSYLAFAKGEGEEEIKKLIFIIFSRYNFKE